MNLGSNKANFRYESKISMLEQGRIPSKNLRVAHKRRHEKPASILKRRLSGSVEEKLTLEWEGNTSFQSLNKMALRTIVLDYVQFVQTVQAGSNPLSLKLGWFWDEIRNIFPISWIEG
jgi:hypothetical protein